jgi:hypothetical protein
MKNDSMIAALKAAFFEGWLAHFRRIQTTRIDLLTVPFNKWGGSFVIEVAKCPPEGITTAWGEFHAPNKCRAWDVPYRPRHRLGSPTPGKDGVWCRYDDDTPVEVVAKEAAGYPSEADHWSNQ